MANYYEKFWDRTPRSLLEGIPLELERRLTTYFNRVKALRTAESGDNPNTSIAFWVKPSD
jgi:hypothetical protein